ncbi:hypothetical protein [Nonomuraea sediminis]|uniref:hypothetical protein n=1 Tax=Nonomuraea sediminis TaxID=2835864 RepID=UPI001BDBF552|nr:hypothetical protein [Nonomuraea sediminis]
MSPSLISATAAGLGVGLRMEENASCSVARTAKNTAEEWIFWSREKLILALALNSPTPPEAEAEIPRCVWRSSSVFSSCML